MAEEHDPLSPAAPPEPARDHDATLPLEQRVFPGAITPLDNGMPPAAPAPALARPDGSPRPAKKETPTPAEPKDVVREIAETIVFVIVLVLLLKTFIAEAFVIPTGSMATSLWGYQKYVECPQCRYQFPVNCSSQVDPQDQAPVAVMSCKCPNCDLHINFNSELDPPWNSGDRVLVFKSWFDSGLGAPHRLDVVVFKFPVEPQKDYVAMNYIKRLVGLPGETIAISRGQLYVYAPEGGRQNPPAPPKDQAGSPIYFSLAPRQDYSWPDDNEAEDLFKAGKFTILRKSPVKVLALARIVNDNDHQAPDLVGKLAPRWSAEAGWAADNDAMPKRFSHAAGPKEPTWLRYKHYLREHDGPQPITDFMGYNSSKGGGSGGNFVNDLMLECQAEVEAAAGGLWLELSKGPDRFQARIDLATGECKLIRVQKRAGQVVETELAKAVTTVKQAGKYHLRLANFDERLTLWIDDALPFGDGVAYDPPVENWPDKHTDNDLEPASITAPGGAVSVSGLKLWRDTYYTNYGSRHTYYVQPGHYLCLGDNSAESSDGRYWGLVPERLMLGRALMVYFPFKFPYPPLNLPANRVGPIH